jgi:hypothetical protein
MSTLLTKKQICTHKYFAGKKILPLTVVERTIPDTHEMKTIKTCCSTFIALRQSIK